MEKDEEAPDMAQGQNEIHHDGGEASDSRASATVEKSNEEEDDEEEDEEEVIRKKRYANAIHSRRKRERKRIEMEVLREQSATLSAANMRIYHKNKKLEQLIKEAKRIVADVQGQQAQRDAKRSPRNAPSSDSQEDDRKRPAIQETPLGHPPLQAHLQRQPEQYRTGLGQIHDPRAEDVFGLTAAAVLGGGGQASSLDSETTLMRQVWDELQLQSLRAPALAPTPNDRTSEALAALIQSHHQQGQQVNPAATPSQLQLLQPRFAAAPPHLQLQLLQSLRFAPAAAPPHLQLQLLQSRFAPAQAQRQLLPSVLALCEHEQQQLRQDQSRLDLIVQALNPSLERSESPSEQSLFEQQTRAHSMLAQRQAQHLLLEPQTHVPMTSFPAAAAPLLTQDGLTASLPARHRLAEGNAGNLSLAWDALSSQTQDQQLGRQQQQVPLVMAHNNNNINSFLHQTPQHLAQHPFLHQTPQHQAQQSSRSANLLALDTILGALAGGDQAADTVDASTERRFFRGGQMPQPPPR